MEKWLRVFELIARDVHKFSAERVAEPKILHPFDERNIHTKLPAKVKELFDDGHYPEATFAAFKFIDKLVARHAASRESGYKLMMAAFNESKPLIKLNALIEVSEQDEQKGYAFLFSGGSLAIRNPRGHEVDLQDNPDTCLDHLALASLLLRRLEAAGFMC